MAFELRREEREKGRMREREETEEEEGEREEGGRDKESEKDLSHCLPLTLATLPWQQE